MEEETAESPADRLGGPSSDIPPRVENRKAKRDEPTGTARRSPMLAEVPAASGRAGHRRFLVPPD